MHEKISVLFVCMGNICRSPMAEGVFRKLVATANLSQHIVTDSAGTHAYHVGEPADRRAQETALKHGVDISDLHARKVLPQDFGQFQYILAMDNDNLQRLRSLCPPAYQPRLHLFLEFAAELTQRQVPDPYYGGPQGFEQVYTLVEAAARGLLHDIQQRYLV
ncbi:MAG: low molecular weight phosphotyrosine protein phosphatase [Gammaproteobacteria bacterium]|nr:low molecular weight phosphotyrosine protein phosphatase [Gammaproteobacteria bacterium]